MRKCLEHKQRIINDEQHDDVAQTSLTMPLSLASSAKIKAKLEIKNEGSKLYFTPLYSPFLNFIQTSHKWPVIGLPQGVLGVLVIYVGDITQSNNGRIKLTQKTNIK